MEINYSSHFKKEITENHIYSSGGRKFIFRFIALDLFFNSMTKLINKIKAFLP